jgi:hypothetical protein
MTLKSIAISVAAIAMMAGGAKAQSAQNVVSSEVWIEEVRKQGVLTGCSLRFVIGYQDYAYRRGAISSIGGTIGIHSVAREKPQACAGGNLKIVGVDFDQDLKSSAFFPVSHAYLSLPGNGLNRQLPVEGRYQCDEPTAFCGFYGLVLALDIVGAVMDKDAAAVSIVFSRGGINISIPVTLDEKARPQLSACWLSLMPEVRSCVSALQSSSTR